MSKLSVINRNEKRKKLVVKYAKKRAALEAIVANHEDRPTRTASPHARSCRRCRATRTPRACATAAR